jgi:phenylacetaldehyde dehydrogenase
MITTPHIQLTSRLQSFLSNTEKKMLIHGEWVAAHAGEQLPVYDPATDELIATVPLAGKEDVDQAVSSARSAFNSRQWKKTAPAERERMLYRLSDLLEQHAATLAQLITLESGKLIREAYSSDVMSAVNTFRYYAGWCTKIEGSTLDLSLVQPSGKENFAYTKTEPLGVIAAITPWNFPLSIIAWKVAPALAAGCTVVLKPSEETPLIALLLGELAMEAGFPAGVLNILTGNGKLTGAQLVTHPGIDKITFTGSTQTGKTIGKLAMDQLTEISLELGGKSPVIVFEDADLAAAAKGIVSGIFRNMGQVCVAGSRVYIHKKHFDSVMADVCLLTEKMKIAPGFDTEAELGPLISKDQQNKVLDYIKKGQNEKTILLSGGKKLDGKGNFMQPAIFTSTDNSNILVQEEIFGPVLVAIPFDDFDDAIRKANDTVYGLSSSIWTQQISTAHKAIDSLQAGWVFVNSPARSDPNFPLGGHKQSGLGRELGKAGLYQYTKQKSVTIIY